MKTAETAVRIFTWCARIRDFTQQNMHLLIGPVVENSRQDVQVRFRQVIFKEVSCSYREDKAVSYDHKTHRIN